MRHHREWLRHVRDIGSGVGQSVGLYDDGIDVSLYDSIGVGLYDSIDVGSCVGACDGLVVEMSIGTGELGRQKRAGASAFLSARRSASASAATSTRTSASKEACSLARAWASSNVQVLAWASGARLAWAVSARAPARSTTAQSVRVSDAVCAVSAGRSRRPTSMTAMPARDAHATSPRAGYCSNDSMVKDSERAG